MIGIIGSAGDLGVQVLEWARAIETEEVITFDSKDPSSTHKSATEVIADASITHLCAPLSVLDEVDNPATKTQVVLHNSVMRPSFEAVEKHRDRLSNIGFSIVHCLMDETDRTVNVARGHCPANIQKHLQQLGLKVRPKTIAEHDRIEALSQGVAVVMVELVLAELAQIDPRDLTPSGKWLLKLLQERDMKWEDPTKASVLSSTTLRDLLSPNSIREVLSRYR